MTLLELNNGLTEYKQWRRAQYPWWDIKNWKLLVDCEVLVLRTQYLYDPQTDSVIRQVELE